jgi:hypothetical protein
VLTAHKLTKALRMESKPFIPAVLDLDIEDCAHVLKLFFSYYLNTPGASVATPTPSKRMMC